MANKKQEGLRAGNVSIEDITVYTNKTRQNITNQILSIEIFEDLFSPFISGTINVKESYDFINLFPFIGDEFLILNIHTPPYPEKFNIRKTFYIYKVSDRIIAGDRSVMYQLHFISREALLDINKNHSKAYSGNISDIAQYICTNIDNGLRFASDNDPTPVNIEKTSNKTKFISNFWSPVKCLNYLCETAISESGSSNYLFFENRTGFNFMTLDILYKADAQRTFVYDNYLRDKRGKSSGTIADPEEAYKRIISISVPVLYDYLDRVRSGMYSSEMLITDVMTKRYNVKNFNLSKDFSSNVHLNKYSTATELSNLTNKPGSLIINYPKAYGTFNGYSDVSNASSLQKRLSQLAQAQTTKINIKVFGRTDYTVGMKVYVDLNQMRPISKNEDKTKFKDNILSGNYIISAANHVINRAQHECVLELIKDTFIIDLNTGKP